MMPAAREPLTLPEAVRRLRGHYGPPEGPPTADPFELVLLENVAYLASSAKRRQALLQLRETIGTSPEALLAAPPGALESVTAQGILKGLSADKLRACAEIVLDRFEGDLEAALAGSVEKTKKVLRTFPGIGEPGAEKILLFSGRHPFLAPESNGLRVLVRLGLVREEGSYANTYAASRRAAEDLPAKIEARQEAHLLLQQHGQTLCKRNDPRCDLCPLALDCAYRRTGG
jgi:endonuclease-3